MRVISDGTNIVLPLLRPVVVQSAHSSHAYKILFFYVATRFGHRDQGEVVTDQAAGSW